MITIRWDPMDIPKYKDNALSLKKRIKKGKASLANPISIGFKIFISTGFKSMKDEPFIDSNSTQGVSFTGVSKICRGFQWNKHSNFHLSQNLPRNSND